MDIYALCEIVICVFAAIGVYSVCTHIVGAFAEGGRTTLGVLASTCEDVASLDAEVQAAKTQNEGDIRPVLLFEYEADIEYLEGLDYGLDIYVRYKN